MGPPRAKLHTPRLLLRPYCVADAEDLSAAIGIYDVARWLGRVPYPYDIAAARAFTARAATRPGRDWLIERDGRIIGGISVSRELGYWLARPAWGQGFATEACDAAIDAFFADRRATELMSSHFEGNARSKRVLAKLGFEATGTVASVPSAALSQSVASHEMRLTRRMWQGRRHFRLATPRLKLRELRDSDLAALCRIGGHPDVAPMLWNVPSPWTEAAARRWLDAARYRGRPGFRAAICRWGRLIGAVGLGAPRAGHPADCAFFLDPRHRGRGLATEALAAFTTDTMRRFEIETLGAAHFADNPAGGAVLRHVGFREIGRGIDASQARAGAHPTVLYRLERAPAP